MKPELTARIPLFFLFTLLIAALATALAAAPSPPGQTAAAGGANPGAPSIRFTAPEHDFGRVLAGAVLKHDFEFTNSGAGLLVIQDVRSTCGCATASNWSRQVEPGKMGRIPIELHSSKFTGPVAKQVTVLCNDREHPVVTLEVKATVWRPFEVSPESAAFVGILDSVTNLSRVVRIVNRQAVPLTLSEPHSSRSEIAAELVTSRPGQEYQLVVKLVPPLGAGNVFGQITMSTSVPDMPLLTVPVWAVAQPAVMVLPAQLSVPASPLPDSLTNTVSFHSNWAQPLVVSEPSIDAKGVGLQLTEVETGRHFVLRATFPPGFELARGRKLELTVKTNHPRFPVIKVPIVSRPPPAGVAAGPASAGDTK